VALRLAWKKYWLKVKAGLFAGAGRFDRQEWFLDN
jgi:hypothetical protein